MAEILVGQLEADTGEILYPHTMSTVVFGPDGKSVEEKINGLSSKIDILCTANSGYKITLQKNYQINNVVYYNLQIQKADGGAFDANAILTIATMPTGKRPIASHPCSSWVGNYLTSSAFLTSAGEVKVKIHATGQTEIRIFGEVVL